ncbi:MAG: hypothetical protein PHH14_05885 [Candidatus Margulisbacteria bacterium]|nr:hypothetical protein [Candidatus Margulisiibacteriota bacterium]
MNGPIFPYANIIIGVLIFLIGFVFHWAGQLFSILNWELAAKAGLQEKRLLPEYKVYEHAFATADSLIAWIYGIIAFGLIINAPWGYRLACFPGAIFIYHALCYWFWTGNQTKAGRPMQSRNMRIGWFAANSITGILAVLLAWNY